MLHDWGRTTNKTGFLAFIVGPSQPCIGQSGIFTWQSHGSDPISDPAQKKFNARSLTQLLKLGTDTSCSNDLLSEQSLKEAPNS